MGRRALGPAALAITAALREHAPPDRAWLVGCSGGRDSLALAVVAAMLAAREGHECRTLVVDHGLQPDSAAVAARTVAQLTDRDVAAGSVRVQVDPNGGPEAGARRARYAALREAAAAMGGADILVGHTLDDQAETVLLGLLRGSGTRALAGMAVRSAGLVRPLLGLRRSATETACSELGLEWWDDPHNSATAYARSRVRGSVLPVLEAELGPGIAEALARTARLARDDADLLDDLAARTVDPATDDLAVSVVAPLPSALRRRVLLDWLRRRGGVDVRMVHVEAVDALLTQWRGQGPIDVPGGVRVIRIAGHLRVVTG